VLFIRFHLELFALTCLSNQLYTCLNNHLHGNIRRKLRLYFLKKYYICLLSLETRFQKIKFRVYFRKVIIEIYFHLLRLYRVFFEGV